MYLVGNLLPPPKMSGVQIGREMTNITTHRMWGIFALCHQPEQTPSSTRAYALRFAEGTVP